MMEFYQLIIIIILFSAIQSIIGIGLLLFGTPTLLLLGYAYPEVLWILLPSSCVLSLLQIIEGYDSIATKKKAYFYTVPSLVVSLIIVIKLDYAIDMKKIVGIILLLIVAMRFLTFPDTWMKIVLKRYKDFFYLLIGFIHGFSNLGGAPLSVIVSGTHKDRQTVNANIAFVYFILALSQLLVLFSYESKTFSVSYLLFIPLVVSNHLVLSRFFTRKVNNITFKNFINLVILVFGVICLL